MKSQIHSEQVVTPRGVQVYVVDGGDPTVGYQSVELAMAAGYGLGQDSVSIRTARWPAHEITREAVQYVSESNPDDRITVEFYRRHLN